jgi:hypothetical protein
MRNNNQPQKPRFTDVATKAQPSEEMTNQINSHVNSMLNHPQNVIEQTYKDLETHRF